jgi:predicted DNA-binding transcriptional regulator AlpA
MVQESITPGRRLIKGHKGLRQKNGRSRSQNWRDVRDGKLPAPIEIGPNSVAWFEDEIDEWLASRPRQTYRATVDPASSATDGSAAAAAEPALDRQLPDQRAARRRSRHARNLPGGRDD